VIGITPRVYAGFSPSEIMTFSPAERSGEIKKIQKFLETKMVRERLKDFGFTTEEIQTRLDQMNDQQIHQIARQLDTLEVGGDGLGVVIAILVIAILVIIIIQLLGHRIVIK
jgi:hypothetical protein